MLDINPQSDLPSIKAEEHVSFMSQALKLAAKGLYTTSPNPRVGCVLVKAGVVIATAWHRRAGEGHAEVNALAQAGDKAAGSTAYITLEPCSHQGRTPPCVDALIKAQLAKVVIAMVDPNPLVAGAGVERLRAAGIETVVGVLEDQARCLNRGFIKRMTTGLPWVTCKLAMSLDGRTAMASGESQWITSPAARQEVQRLRARSCAILTGIGTVLADDASLTVREAELGLDQAALLELGELHQPLRVVVDSRQRLPVTAKILQGPARTLVANLVAKEGTEGLDSVQIPANAEGRIDLYHLLQYLAQQECNEVLLEAGATLAGSMLQAQLIDEIKLFVAPKLLGNKARGLFDLGFETMSEQLSLQINDVRAIGLDWYIEAIPQYKPFPSTNNAPRAE